MADVVLLESDVEQADDNVLVELAKRGDRDAAEALLLRYELLIHRICRHVLPAGEDCEGAAQEVFLRALRKLDHFSGQGSFQGWLSAIAVNYCRDRLRRHRLILFRPLETQDEEELDPLATLFSDEPNPERVAMARQAVRLLRREFTALPERQREVFALRFFVGLDLEAIAQSLGVDVGTVKTHLFRAVHRVRSAVVEARP